MHIMFQIASGKHVMTLNDADLRVAPAFPGSVFYAMIGGAFENEQAYSRQALLKAATVLRGAIERDHDLLPFLYSFELKIMGREDMCTKGSGGASGFHIDGRECSIWSGPGRCYLEEMVTRADGSRLVVRQVDVRAKKRIKTDDCGDIKLTRRKLNLTLHGELSSLITFLTGADDEDVRVVAS